eukprot:40598_1
MTARHKLPRFKDKDATKPKVVQLDRQFQNNPFKDRPSRWKLVSSKHESILKQFSSTHFAVPTSTASDIPIEAQQFLASMANFDDPHTNKDTHGAMHVNTRSTSHTNDETHDIIELSDVDEFEFPYYLKIVSHNLTLMKQRFVQQQRVEALKRVIQSARLLIDDLVLSEPQFYPAIYVLVSKLLDKFGALVYERLHSLAVHNGDSSMNEQYAHNFIPQTAAAATQSPAHDDDGNRVQTFSEMHQRMQYDAEDMKTENIETLPLNFRASHCSILCQIKCGNWFFKISAIRELVPRILVEISLYRTLRFLYPLRELLSYTQMLMKRLRGISNPLIAGYVTVFALEQIFVTFGTNSFVYDDDLVNEKQGKMYAKNVGTKHGINAKRIKDNEDKTCDFDMIEDLYLTALNDVLFIFKSMYDTNFMYVECVFYGQMASEDYLNLFNPIFSMMFDILKYNKALRNAKDIKLYLKQNINPDLLKLIDCDAFLGINIKSHNQKNPPYAMNLENADENTQYVD